MNTWKELSYCCKVYCATNLIRIFEGFTLIYKFTIFGFQMCLKEWKNYNRILFEIIFFISVFFATISKLIMRTYLFLIIKAQIWINLIKRFVTRKNDSCNISRKDHLLKILKLSSLKKRHLWKYLFPARHLTISGRIPNLA